MKSIYKLLLSVFLSLSYLNSAETINANLNYDIPLQVSMGIKPAGLAVLNDNGYDAVITETGGQTDISLYTDSNTIDNIEYRFTATFLDNGKLIHKNFPENKINMQYGIIIGDIPIPSILMYNRGNEPLILGLKNNDIISQGMVSNMVFSAKMSDDQVDNMKAGEYSTTISLTLSVI